MTTTQTGIRIEECGTCGHTHPVNRAHCTLCGRASLFLNHSGACIRHEPERAFLVVEMERDYDGEEWVVAELDLFTDEDAALDAADSLGLGLKRGHWAEVRTVTS